ncbi:MAG TPA: flagellin modification protein A [Porphyromonadaceae bacterium]|nr:flagellin modification protein A [Porphyromonadaceae bacterium]HBX18961.1 flagellin modification protein A [Porphyromonadaceae bacterium]
MFMLLKDKVFVVTGGAGLLGKEFCKSITDNGGISVIADYDVPSAEKVKQYINSDNIYIERIDITNEVSIFELINRVNTNFGKIDGLVNCAYPKNKNYGKHFFDISYNDFCENINMNLGGCFLTSQLFAKFFYRQGYGNIINIASIYGIIAPRFEIYKDTIMTMPVEYAAIKSGLIHLTKYMAKYFKGKNIRVNTISLGGLQDGQPTSFLNAYKNFCINKGMLSPQDISGTLIYLLSDLSEYVNGQNIIVDDGFTL